MPHATGVQGLGMMSAWKLDGADAKVAARCVQNGLLILTAKGAKLRFLPPLNITRRKWTEASAKAGSRAGSPFKRSISTLKCMKIMTTQALVAAAFLSLTQAVQSPASKKAGNH